MYSVAPVYGLDEPTQYVELNYDGIDILACKTIEGYVVERIYSTNPNDFLKINLQPGTLLENALIK